MRIIKITTIIFVLIIVSYLGWNNLFVSKRVVSLEEFDSIEVNGNVQIHLRPGLSEKVTLRADDDIVDDISIKVVNGVLKICNQNCGNSSRVLEANVNFVSIKNIVAAGSSSVTSRGILEGASMNIEAKGSAELKIRIAFDSLKLKMIGAANVQLAGEVNHFNLLINDVGDLMAYNLVSQHCVAYLNTMPQSPGIARINAQKTLHVEIHGPRHLNFKGDAKVIGKTISGSGELNRF